MSLRAPPGDRSRPIRRIGPSISGPWRAPRSRKAFEVFRVPVGPAAVRVDVLHAGNGTPISRTVETYSHFRTISRPSFRYLRLNSLSYPQVRQNRDPVGGISDLSMWRPPGDGGISSFGDATFEGSMGGQPLKTSPSAAWPPPAACLHGSDISARTTGRDLAHPEPSADLVGHQELSVVAIRARFVTSSEPRNGPPRLSRLECDRRSSAFAEGQILVDRADARRSLADGRSHPLDRSGAYVPDREKAGSARFVRGAAHVRVPPRPQRGPGPAACGRSRTNP